MAHYCLLYIQQNSVSKNKCFISLRTSDTRDIPMGGGRNFRIRLSRSNGFKTVIKISEHNKKWTLTSHMKISNKIEESYDQYNKMCVFKLYI